MSYYNKNVLNFKLLNKNNYKNYLIIINELKIIIYN